MNSYSTGRLKESLHGPAESRGAISLSVLHCLVRALTGWSCRLQPWQLNSDEIRCTDCKSILFGYLISLVDLPLILGWSIVLILWHGQVENVKANVGKAKCKCMQSYQTSGFAHFVLVGGSRNDVIHVLFWHLKKRRWHSFLTTTTTGKLKLEIELVCEF